MKSFLALILVCFSVVALAADDFFPKDYDASRARFRATCAAHGGVCQSYTVDSASDHDLTIDYGSFHRKGERLLVLQSGIHGVETPAGAAAQQLFMEKYLERMLNRGVDVLLIHALNPYGFRHERRTDEFNVNLNRNFFSRATPLSENTPYRDLRAMFEPAGAINSIATSSLLSHANFIRTYIAAKFDKRYINQAMNSGQYEFEKGLNFGGREPSQQMRFLKQVLPPIFNRYAGQILYLDFHTGLGENGVLQVMNGLKPSPSFLSQMASVFEPLISAGVKMTNANDTSDPDFFTDQGDVIDFVPTLHAQPENVLALTMEFGTMGVDTLNQLRSASRMILENQAHFFGCSAPEVCETAQADFRELFNPSEPAWRSTVTREADLVFAALAEKF